MNQKLYAKFLTLSGERFVWETKERMKLLFQMKDHVHAFELVGDLGAQDLVILKESLFRFFQSEPKYTVLDFSNANLKILQTEFDYALSEIHTYAQARGLHLVIARTEAESGSSKKLVLENALIKKIEVAQARLQIRQKIQEQTELLVIENAYLKSSMKVETQTQEINYSTHHRLSPILEKIWSEK